MVGMVMWGGEGARGMPTSPHRHALLGVTMGGGSWGSWDPGRWQFPRRLLGGSQGLSGPPPS